jgi:hypothetical protein
MSAFIVDRGHVRFLIDAGLRLPPRLYEGNTLSWRGQELTRENASAVGLMLWDECRRSVAYRYHDEPEADLPGPMSDGPRFGYAHSPSPLKINPLAVLKAISCYEYQSCEHPEWKSSEAHAFCDALRLCAISCLPGYEEAPWGAPDGWECDPPQQTDIDRARMKRAAGATS